MNPLVPPAFNQKNLRKLLLHIGVRARIAGNMRNGVVDTQVWDANPGENPAVAWRSDACKFGAGQGLSWARTRAISSGKLEADGWYFVGATGSHHHFKHPVRPGKVTVPHPRRDLHPKTIRSIYRQARLIEPR